MDQEQMPMEALLQILQDSLEKKVTLLAQIEDKSKEQEAILKKENFTIREVDENMDAKSELIAQLSLLDSGFESLYDKIREELLRNKELYRIQIEEIQNLIVEVTARGVSIEAIEARNKVAIEGYFTKAKRELQKARSVSSVARSYYQTAKKTVSTPQIFDTKK